MECNEFFTNPQNTVQKRYEALRAFYVEKRPGKEIAKQFGYTLSSFYSLTRDFKNQLSQNNPAQYFFISNNPGRKPKDTTGKTNQLIIQLRKKYLSVTEIKAILDVKGFSVSDRYVYDVIKKEGFDRLPRRNYSVKKKQVLL